ncbi:putative signal transduction protein with EAL and GGDEF domain [Saccharopolyspora lacisalsi]|uniref:Putative signal transduction protein with EAL and GGDEF domain n=1 Tax=Halosaccharopolyspora lacisalsi TaxID=1000566 RepID=A0A839DSX7_9PSEU|nr:tetratricopeptide repeat protein [Halosaccharopolyspora lacisalsi]MBA8823376.1 putative signal transduction protein with EAL and GGDEF domain [Halosaccharopolyspora lacisalsi]
MAQRSTARRLLGPRAAAILLAVVLVGYLVLMGSRSFTMILSGQPVFVALGVAVLVLPVLGVLLVTDQIRFGARTEHLARRLDDEDALPDVSHLPLRPSGRVRRDAADVWFDEKQAELESDPEDWRAWFALAQAYDLAGDRNRGRKAMRKAIEMERAETTG